MPIHSPALSKKAITKALTELSKKDAFVQRLFAKNGAPPLWARPQTFDTLVLIVLEQKVSLASARAVMQRVRALQGMLEPQAFLDIPTALLRTAGVSERKVSYCRSIAEALVDKNLVLNKLNAQSDQQVMDTLAAIRGIGPWTAGVYLMMALKRPDAWASGDRALQVSYAEQMALDTPPNYAELDQIAEQWKPYRGSVARLLWHAYLIERGVM